MSPFGRAGGALLAASVLALGGCGSNNFDPDNQVGPNPVLPEPTQYLIPPIHVKAPVGWGNAMPKVAAGLAIEPLATNLQNPRTVYTLPNGDILVVESDDPGLEPIERPKDVVMTAIMSFAHGSGKGGNRVTLLRDTNGDGRPDLRTLFLDHLFSPFGIVLVGNDLYVANTDAIVRYPYVPGATRITAPGQILTELPGGPIDHHWTKSLTASPDGSKLYVGIGSNSNITENGKEAERGRAMIWEVDRATGAHRPYATGLRNPNGLTFYPGSTTLWTVVNERDELGPNLVPDYMTAVRPGAFYGWPYSYYGQHVDKRVHPQRPDLVARAIKPDYALGSHVAPLGLAFYTGGGAMPAQFAGGAFVGEHGSWDRWHLNGYRVVFVPFANGRPSGKAIPVVDGFASSDGVRGRPVGVGFDRSGALLIADDAGKTVWRVRATGAGAPSAAPAAARGGA